MILITVFNLLIGFASNPVWSLETQSYTGSINEKLICTDNDCKTVRLESHIDRCQLAVELEHEANGIRSGQRRFVLKPVSWQLSGTRALKGELQIPGLSQSIASRYVSQDGKMKLKNGSPIFLMEGYQTKSSLNVSSGIQTILTYWTDKKTKQTRVTSAEVVIQAKDHHMNDIQVIYICEF